MLFRSAQTWNNNYDDSSEKDILIWNYAYNRPERVNEMSEKRGGSVGIVVSGRFFPQCYSNFRRVFFCQVSKYFFNLLGPKNTAFRKTFSSCWDAFKMGGLISPKTGSSTKVMKDDGSIMECTFENLKDNTKSCPSGWFGLGDEGSCFKVRKEPVDNDEAAALCNQESGDLVQPKSLEEDEYIIDVLSSVLDYAKPFHPGFYHIGTYQRQSGNLYYHRNGIRV